MVGNAGIYGRHAARRYHVNYKSSVTDGGSVTTEAMGDIVVDTTDGKIAYVDSSSKTQELD